MANRDGGSHIRLGDSYRFPRADHADIEAKFVDGYLNWFHLTKVGDKSRPSLRPQRGIWNPQRTLRDGESQIPLVICGSSPHKWGSLETPWHDVVRPDEGFAIYYGDNKDSSRRNAVDSDGNRVMLETMRLQHSDSQQDRELAPPILLMTTLGEDGPGKGFRRFEGLGVITGAQVVLQRSPTSQSVFQNLRFDIAILDLSSDNEMIDPRWLDSRRDESCTRADDLRLAPQAWKEFVAHGITSAERLRRRVLRSLVIPTSEQLPPEGSNLRELLDRTHKYFESSHHDFEHLAARVVERIFVDRGLEYRTGWITPKSGDGGFDFVGRLDFDPIGGFPSSRQVVLGQAKCESPTRPSGGRELARLAARLRRGWHGAFVTTSFFSKAVQREVIIDRYPMVLAPGGRVAEVLQSELLTSRLTLNDYLGKLSKQFPSRPGGIDDAELVLSL